VPFEVKLPLQGPVDGLDHLPERLEQVLPGAASLARADRAQQHQLTPSEIFFEGAAEVVLVPDQRLARVGVHHVAGVVEHAQQHLALIGLGTGQREQHRQPGQGGDQVQPQPPEIPGVRRA
jgi:hypothetical protein